jgi:hypothetical protein
VNGEVCLLDVHVPPDCAHNFVPGNHSIVVFHKKCKDLKGTSGHLHRIIIQREELLGGVENVPAKSEEVRRYFRHFESITIRTT